MHTVGKNSYARTALATIAVLCVAIPSLVFAAGPASNYPAPRTAQLLGPATVAPGNIGAYTLYVGFVDGTHASFTGAPAQFSVPATEGTFTGNSLHVNSGYSGYVLITGKLTESGYSVTTNRVVTTH
jgi:hypothetical protein